MGWRASSLDDLPQVVPQTQLRSFLHRAPAAHRLLHVWLHTLAHLCAHVPAHAPSRVLCYLSHGALATALSFRPCQACVMPPRASSSTWRTSLCARTSRAPLFRSWRACVRRPRHRVSPHSSSHDQAILQGPRSQSTMPLAPPHVPTAAAAPRGEVLTRALSHMTLLTKRAGVGAASTSQCLPLAGSLTCSGTHSASADPQISARRWSCTCIPRADSGGPAGLLLSSLDVPVRTRKQPTSSC